MGTWFNILSELAKPHINPLALLLPDSSRSRLQDGSYTPNVYS